MYFVVSKDKYFVAITLHSFLLHINSRGICSLAPASSKTKAMNNTCVSGNSETVRLPLAT